MKRPSKVTKVVVYMMTYASIQGLAIDMSKSGHNEEIGSVAEVHLDIWQVITLVTRAVVKDVKFRGGEILQYHYIDVISIHYACHTAYAVNFCDCSASMRRKPGTWK